MPETLNFWNFITASAAATSSVEWAATLLLIVYVILAARNMVLCWPFGIAGSALSAWFYFTLEHPLFMEALLNIGYVVLGMYGWYVWRNKKSKTADTVKIVSVSVGESIMLLMAGIAGTTVLWSINHFALHAQNAFGDAAIAMFSIVATWMTARKQIENWLVWIATDMAAGFLYIGRGKEMYLFALLYFIYSVLAVYGWQQWKKQIRQS